MITNGTGTTASKVLKIIGTLFLVGVLAAAIYLSIFMLYVKNELMSDVGISQEDLQMKLSSVLYYTDPATGDVEELVTLQSKEKRTYVDYENIPKDFEHAFVSVEDKRFYTHHGVDWYRTTGAFFNMFLSMKNTFGGSTITQQLIKNVTGYDDNTVRRKVLEIFRALEFEKTYDKKQIIEWYLNEVYFGHGQYGIEAASQYYFGKSINELSLAEITSIVGITNNPSLYSPYLYKENNKNRQEIILGLMRDQGYISQEQYDEAVNEELHFLSSHSKNTDPSMSEDTHYSYFVDAVIEDVIQDLMKVKNVSYDMAETLLLTGGYKIYTTLDPHVQECIDEIYSDESKVPKSRNSKKLQSAIVVIDPNTGNIVGLSGGIGQKTGDRVLNRATQTKRPSGSSIKPLATYSPAMEAGLITPETLIEDDESVKLKGTDWMPNNDDLKYNGVVTIRTAICKSLNTIAAQVMDMLTPQASFDFLTKKLGFTSLIEYRDGKSDINYAPLALGQQTDGVTVREMATGFTMLANKGEWIQSRTYTAIYDRNGNLVYENNPEKIQAVSETTAYWITDMLADAVSFGTGTTARLSGMPTAGKTGTSSKTQDRWFCGYTPYYVAAVWSGYDNPSTLDVSGNPSAKLFNSVMTLIHKGLEKKSFYKPASTSYEPVPGLAAVEYTIRCVDLWGSVIKEETKLAVVGKEYEKSAIEVDGYLPIETGTKKIIMSEDPTQNVITFMYRLPRQDPLNPGPNPNDPTEPEDPVDPVDPDDPDNPDPSGGGGGGGTTDPEEPDRFFIPAA